MRSDYYLPGTVESLLQTDLVTDITRSVLKNRLNKETVVTPLFFDEKIFPLLQAVCSRLIPQDDRLNKIDLAGLSDEQMVKSTGNGWRYAEMPPDDIAYKAGLQGVDETSFLMFDKAFILLQAEEQDMVLYSIQSGDAKGKIWEQLPSGRFFEELLAFLVELYYSHPHAKDEMGDISFADAKGWQQTGLDELEACQPLPLRNSIDDK